MRPLDHAIDERSDEAELWTLAREAALNGIGGRYWLCGTVTVPLRASVLPE